MYEAAREVIGRGGVCVTAKLPYDNIQKDHFTMTKFKVADRVISSGDHIKDLSSVDRSLKTCLSVTAVSSYDLIDIETLDGYKTGSLQPQADEVAIIDISRANYGKATLLSTLADGVFSSSVHVECLGIMPVLVGAANAMFYQGLISSQTSCTADGVETTDRLSAY